jgi:hypothetical protein
MLTVPTARPMIRGQKCIVVVQNLDIQPPIVITLRNLLKTLQNSFEFSCNFSAALRKGICVSPG